MRPIDADELELEAYGIWVHGTPETQYRMNALKDLIDQAPTIDAVPVTRCKDCRHSTLLGDSDLRKESPWCYYMEHCRICLCTDLVEDEALLVEDNFFCAYGERKTEEFHGTAD